MPRVFGFEIGEYVHTRLGNGWIRVFDQPHDRIGLEMENVEFAGHTLGGAIGNLRGWWFFRGEVHAPVAPPLDPEIEGQGLIPGEIPLAEQPVPEPEPELDLAVRIAEIGRHDLGQARQELRRAQQRGLFDPVLVQQFQRARPRPWGNDQPVVNAQPVFPIEPAFQPKRVKPRKEE